MVAIDNSFITRKEIIGHYSLTKNGLTMKSPKVPTFTSPALLDIDDAVILLLDHQAGLFQTVKDITIAELRTNTTALAKFFRC